MPDGDFTQIERRVADDRAALTRSLDLLSETLAPKKLARDARDTAQSVGSDITRQLWGATRENPAAFAMLGLGCALLLSNTGRRPEDGAHRAPQAVDPMRAMDGFDERVAAADAKIHPKPAQVSSHRLRDALNAGLDKLPPAARKRVIDARLTTIRAQEAVERRAARATARASQTVRNQPVIAGAVAFGIGTLAATLLPSTRSEDEILGARRDALMAQAKSALDHEMAALQDSFADPARDTPGDVQADLSDRT